MGTISLLSRIGLRTSDPLQTLLWRKPHALAMPFYLGFGGKSSHPPADPRQRPMRRSPGCPVVRSE
ncbi:hypothetical protein ACSBR2_028904 [Camellia fascicularis]